MARWFCGLEPAWKFFSAPLMENKCYFTSTISRESLENAGLSVWENEEDCSCELAPPPPAPPPQRIYFCGRPEVWHFFDYQISPQECYYSNTIPRLAVMRLGVNVYLDEESCKCMPPPPPPSPSPPPLNSPPPPVPPLSPPVPPLPVSMASMEPLANTSASDIKVAVSKLLDSGRTKTTGIAAPPAPNYSSNSTYTAVVATLDKSSPFTDEPNSTVAASLVSPTTAVDTQVSTGIGALVLFAAGSLGFVLAIVLLARSISHRSSLSSQPLLSGRERSTSTGATVGISLGRVSQLL